MTSPFTVHPSPFTTPYVLLHGWGVNAAVWTDLKQRLAAPCFAPDLFAYLSWPTDAGGAEALARAILERAPARATWVGWSLGGMLAMLAARFAPEQIEKLVLVATTPRFVAGPNWEHGISEKTLADFCAGLANDLPATLKRFLLLNAGPGDNARALAANTLRGVQERGLPQRAALASGLNLLRELDLRSQLANLRVPVTVVHGTHDRITPPGAAGMLADTIPGARLHLIEKAGHAPFLSHPEFLVALLKNPHARAA